MPTALAQAPYPNKPVRIVVGYSAGGPTDLVARLLAGKLQAATGQVFLVENKPGAGSNLATEQVAGAAPDGYTLLLAAAPITMNAYLYKGLKWDVQKSLEPVSMVMSAPAILAVNRQVGKNLQELIALARQQPGRLTFGSTGNGGSQHMAGELFKQRAGIDIVHVPYKGAAPVLQDLIAGHVTMAFMTSVSLGGLRQGGQGARHRRGLARAAAAVAGSADDGGGRPAGLRVRFVERPVCTARHFARGDRQAAREVARMAASDFREKLQARARWWSATRRPSSAQLPGARECDVRQADQVDQAHPGLSARRDGGQEQALALIAQLEKRSEVHDAHFEHTRVRWRRIGSGPPLVLVHGGNGSWLHWVRNIDALAARHQLWLPDLPGCGESAELAAPASLERLVAALRHNIDSLIGTGRVIDLAAFSFGSGRWPPTWRPRAAASAGWRCWGRPATVLHAARWR